MDITHDWSVAEWQLDPPFVEGFRHVHTPLCRDHPRVVVGVGSSEESVAVLQWAGWEAQLRGTHLHVVNAWEPHGFQGRVQRKQQQRQAKRLMRQTLEKAFPQFPVQEESLTVESRPAEVLVAASHGAALLVVGPQKRGAFGHIFKSAARRGAAFATCCPVAVVREGQHEHPRSGKVAVGVDDSFTSRDALRWAATEAQYRGAELKVVHVAFLQQGTMPGDLSHDEGQMLDRVLGEILVGPLAGVTASVDLEPRYRHTFGDRGREEPIGLILARAAADADLLVVGSHGYGISGGAVTGSITTDCLDAATCPVVVIPACREDEPNSVRDAELAMEREPAPALDSPGTTAPPLPDMISLADHAGLETLPLDVCLRLLESVPVGRVSFCADGEVVTLPVNHVVDRQAVVFRTDRGSKLSAAERQDHVAFEADDYDVRTRTGWSVLAKGRAEVIREDAEIQRLSHLRLYPWVIAVDHPFWIRIWPTSVTGRHTPLTTSR